MQKTIPLRSITAVRWAILILAAMAVPLLSAADTEIPAAERYVPPKLQWQPYVTADHKIVRINGLAADLEGNVYFSDIRSGTGVPTYTYKFDGSWQLKMPKFGYFVPGQFHAASNGDLLFATHSSVFRLDKNLNRIHPTAVSKFVIGGNWSNSQFYGIGQWSGRYSFVQRSDRTLYIAANRKGTEDTGLWTFDASGELVGFVPIAGVIDLAITPDEKFLIAAFGADGVARLDLSGKVVVPRLVQPVTQADRVFVDRAGNLHLFSIGEGLLRRFTADGAPLPFAAKASFINGNALGGGMHDVGKLHGAIVAVDGFGNIYATRRNGTRLEKFGPTGAYKSDMFWVDSLTSPNREQLFVPGEKVQFDATLANRSQRELKLDMRFRMSDVDWKLIQEDITRVTLPAAAPAGDAEDTIRPGTLKVRFRPKARDIGHYRIEVTLLGDGWEKKASTSFGIVPKFDKKFADDSPFGHHRWGPSHLPSLQKVGIKWTRADGYSSWNNVELERGTWNFSGMDAMVDQSAALGLRCYPVYDYLPDWMVPGKNTKGKGYGFGWHNIPKRLGPVDIPDDFADTYAAMLTDELEKMAAGIAPIPTTPELIAGIVDGVVDGLPKLTGTDLSDKQAAAVRKTLTAALEKSLPKPLPGDYSDGLPGKISLRVIDNHRIDIGNDDYANYCGTMAKKYKGRVLAWDIWNEPEFFWGGTPEHYVAMLKKAYAAIKAADPDALVGLSAALGQGGFLEKMYKAGAKGHFDVVTLHYFGAEDPDQIRKTAAAYRRIMKANGDETLPLWDTEERGGPVHAIYAHVIAKEVGIDRVFLFPSHGGAIVNSDGTPTESAVPHAVLASYLEGAVHQKTINLGQRRELFLFKKGRKHFAVGWSLDNDCVVQLSGVSRKVTVVDNYGRRREYRGGRGIVRIPLGATPVYIEGMQPELDRMSSVELKLPDTLKLGQANAVSVIVNTTVKLPDIRVLLKAPKGWTVEPAQGHPFAPAPDRTDSTYRFTVRVPKGAQPDTALEAVLQSVGGAMASVRQSRKTASALKFNVAFGQQIDPFVPNLLRVQITHAFVSPMWGAVRIKQLPDGWVASPGLNSKLINYTPDQPEITVDFNITIPKDYPTPYGSYRFYVEAVAEGRVITGRHVRVSLPRLTENLALKAKISTPDGLVQHPGRSASLGANKGDAALNDGNHGTFSQKVKGAKEYVVQYDWAKPQTMNAVLLATNWGGGFKAFDIICDGKKVATKTNLRYIGNIAVVRFPETTAKRLRLRVFECHANSPVVFEWEVYRLPP